MEQIVLAPLLQVIFDKLANPVLQKFADYWELEDRFKKLQRILPLVQAVIQDAEELQATDKSIRIWLSQLKDAAYKAEDLLEEFTYMQNYKYSKPYAVNFANFTNILDDLQKAAVEGLSFQLAERKTGDKQFEKRETSSFVIGSEVYGRDEDKRKIIDTLFSPSRTVSEGTTSVISIVGTPGIGKTTLAQFIYNDDEVKEHFNLRIWIFVSCDFKAKRIIKAAVESSTGNKCDLVDLEGLQCELWKSLNDKKYLLVLDDVWTEDQDEWDQLRPLFCCGVDGSKVLVTTRSQKVALVLGNSNRVYRLKGLSEDDCFNIFRKRAFFSQTEEENYLNLRGIGKELMRKCGGMPLAAKILGGFMRFKREESDWLCVLKSDLWNLDVYRSKFIPALLLSYLHLPSHLKHCFAFCSIFPKNFEFKREKLIHMWMAQGLILSDGGGKPPEDIGDEYFNELLWMSVFEDVKETEGGFVRGYKINDAFHSLARSITQKDFLVLENQLAQMNNGQVHHASIVCNNRPSLIPEALSQAKHLRTLLVFSEDGLLEVPSDIFSSFIYLRVLDLSGCQTKLPQSIRDISLLKYLDLSNSHFDKLPSGISSLCYLQALNLFGCYNLKCLPSMVQITGLRHLNISGCEALAELPKGIGKLVHLQTLPIFVVPIRLRKQDMWIRMETGLSLMPARIAELKHLNLRGELKIKHLERIDDVEEVKSANLRNKEYLESLGLCWGNKGADHIMNPSLEANVTRFQERKHHVPGPSEEPETHATTSNQDSAGEVLACLQPPKNLKKIFIVGYPGIGFPNWTLPNLTEMELISCRGCVQLPILGHLPLLRSLRMEGMDNITHIGPEFYGEHVVSFPSLQELFMRDFPSLQELLIPNGKEIFPKLSKLVLRKCPNLVSLPLFLSLKHLEIQSCRSITLNSTEELTLLSTLIIEGFDDLSSLPANLLRNNPLLTCLTIKSCPRLQSLGPDFGCLTSLKSLSIQWCEELSLLPEGFKNLNALECFVISDCHSMEILPENPIGGLRSLQILSIENCSRLSSISVGLQYLTALKHLTVMYCPNLAGLPDSLEHLSSLLSLAVISCPLLECLPEGLKHVKTLQSLEIRSCQRISDLPEWLDSFASLRTLAISELPNIKSLPVAVRRLTKLQHLSIQECPHLQRRCQKERGEDWWKVAHVPHKYISSSQQQ
ncbi:putative disease resistance RPP13-like protein 1 [Forsythia ovata]|uniref:Disease resistance RPP13-like protein 1 n=1 Tax=Forsythia ovata TaxID=205694 RepID=A0ABD1TLC3_9LAMI